MAKPICEQTCLRKKQSKMKKRDKEVLTRKAGLEIAVLGVMVG
jgi:hypothetical protein